MMAKHVCPNRFWGDGAKGACFFEIAEGEREDVVWLDVGWSCVKVCSAQIPISWLSEVIAIATAHEGGIAGFLKAHDYGGSSYALQVDPPGGLRDG
jgi:hypothetical protein